MKTADIKSWFERLYPWAGKFKRLKKCKRNDGYVIRVYDAPKLPGCESVLVMSEPSDRNLIVLIQALDHVPETTDLKTWRGHEYGATKPNPPQSQKPAVRYVFDVREMDGMLGVSVSDKAHFDREGCQSDWELDGPDFAALGLGEESEGFFTPYDDTLSVEDVRDMLDKHPLFFRCPKFKAFLDR